MDSEAEATTTTMDAAQFHVLAVDDSIIDRKLIERLLKTSSYRVTTVPSVSKALEFLGLLNTTSTTSTTSNEQQVVVNLIISDYSMPDMTGYDLLRKIKDSDSFKDIPFVIMSSENIPSRINRCLEQGAQDFFLKPVKMSDVNKLKPYLMRSDNNPRIIPSAAAAAAAAKRKTMEAAAADHDGFLLSPHSRSSSRSRFINNMEMTC